MVNVYLQWFIVKVTIVVYKLKRYIIHMYRYADFTIIPPYDPSRKNFHTFFCLVIYVIDRRVEKKFEFVCFVFSFFSVSPERMINDRRKAWSVDPKSFAMISANSFYWFHLTESISDIFFFEVILLSFFLIMDSIRRIRGTMVVIAYYCF